ncbi:MAG: hypothetical protein ACI9E1_001260 [Cryomorphaceae bacterium]|jgi:hypothetical protein
MKRKFIVCLPCVVLSLFISSCGDKKSADSAAGEEQADTSKAERAEVESANPEMDEQVEQIKEIQKQQQVAPVKEEEVRDVAGFAKHLPKETEMFFNAQGIDGLIGSIRGSEIGRLMADLAKKEGDDIDEVMKSDDFQEFLNVAGEDVFISMGDGSAKSLKTMGDVYSIYYRTYYYVIGKMLVNLIDSGDMTESSEAMIQSLAKQVLDELLELDDYRMPSVVAGFKVSSEGDRDRYTLLLQETFAKALELNDKSPEMKNLFEADSVDAYGGFKGVKINCSKMLEVFKSTPKAVEEMEEMGLSKEYMEKLTEKFGDFKLTLLAGNYNDYIVIYLGDRSEGLKFVDQPSDSLLANKQMAFLKEYKGKKVVSVTYMCKEISEEFSKVTTMMEDLSVGVCKFLAETESLGDTLHIQALLKKLAVNSKKLDKITSPGRFGSVAYLEDGFKVDSFHGGDSVMYDLDTHRKLADIAMRKDAVISSSWVVNAANAELAVHNLEDMVNLVYQAAKLTVEHDIKDSEFLEFADMFKMIDGQFSDDLATIWEAVREGVHQGLGNEGAMVMDLKGKMPRVPDVPTIVIENGKIPRLAIGYDVVDRSKLVDSWKVIDATSRKIVSKIESLTNEKINYRKAEYAKKEGADFWSYQLGITSHQANLALGINDQMMFFTTSPAFVEEFVSEYDAEGKRGGMDFKLRMAPMRAVARDWMKLVDKHGDDLSPSFDRADFEESKTLIDEMLKASEEVDSLDFSMRKINGEVRSFFHLNKRN